MALDCWFRADISRILAAVSQAAQSTSEAAGGPDAPGLEPFLIGYRAALRAIAAGFGLPDPTSVGPRPEGTPQQRGAGTHPLGPTVDGTATYPDQPEHWVRR